MFTQKLTEIILKIGTKRISNSLISPNKNPDRQWKVSNIWTKNSVLWLTSRFYGNTKWKRIETFQLHYNRT